MGADPGRRTRGPFALLADWFWSSLSLGAGAILVVLGILVWSSTVAVVIGALLLLAPLARMLVD